MTRGQFVKWDATKRAGATVERRMRLRGPSGKIRAFNGLSEECATTEVGAA